MHTGKEELLSYCLDFVFGRVHKSNDAAEIKIIFFVLYQVLLKKKSS